MGRLPNYNKALEVFAREMVIVDENRNFVGVDFAVMRNRNLVSGITYA